MGKIGILNVGAGDTKLTFDPNDPNEVQRSAAIVADMIRRGFVILIEIGRDGDEPIYRRAKGFDPKTAEYIIAGMALPEEGKTVDKATPAPPRRRGKRSETRVPAASVDAVAVARTAGG